MNWLKQKLIHATWRRCLIFAVAVLYLVLIGIFSLSHWSFLKYLAAILGLLLLAAIPEIDGEEYAWIRLIVGIIAAIGTVVLQVWDDRDRTAEYNVLVQIGENRELHDDLVESIRHDQEKIYDQVAIDPRDTAAALINSGSGYREKATRLALAAMTKEAELMVQHPALRNLILGFPNDSSARIGAYNSAHDPIAQVLRNSHEGSESLEVLIGLFKQQKAYADLANYFDSEIKQLYQPLQPDAPRRLSDKEARAQLREIGAILAKKTSAFPLAGLYNHLGNLAMGTGDTEQAFAYFYQGLVADREHLYMYESLAYLLWAKNRDYRDALGYAIEGLKRTEGSEVDLRNEMANLKTAYDSLMQLEPALTSKIRQRQKTWFQDFAELGQRIDDPAYSLKLRFKLDIAYFSALDLTNETQARELASELYKSDPTDADYQDMNAFVTMMFSDKIEELTAAGGLFIQAQGNPNASILCSRLASAHSKELERKIDDLRRK